MTTRVAFRTCPLCEAGCGLEIAVEEPDASDRSASVGSGQRCAGGARRGRGTQIKRIRGDRDDVFSHGFICPKGSTLKQLHEDRNRLRTPLVRRDGELVAASWDEAFAEIDRRLASIIENHGRDAVSVYLGNPIAHSLAGMLYGKALVKAIGSRNVYTASTVDQRPKELSAGLMFGGALIVPVPDVDRTDFLLILGANPYASNGSLATAPDWPGRIEALRARGGKLVVVDPRRSRTAEEADEWIAVRPGSDPFLLAAMVRVVLDEGLADLGDVAGCVEGMERLAPALSSFGPDEVADVTGVDAATIRRLARELVAAPRAAVYGRIGTTTAEFGTVASWLVDVLNICTGNLDRPGGAMFTTPAVAGSNTHGAPRVGRGVRPNHPRSRVRDLPGTFGELPAVCLAEEIETPGPGQVRGVGVRRRQPGAVTAQRRSPRCRPRIARADGVRRHLRQRDVTARRRDPAVAVGAGEAALRRRPAATRRAQRRQLVGARAAARRRPARRVGGARPPRPRRPGRRSRHRPGRRRRPRDRFAHRTPPSPTNTGRSTGGTADELLAALELRRRVRRGSSTSTCEVVRTEITSEPIPAGSPSTP